MDHETFFWLWVVLTGAFSMGYCIYGWKQQKVVCLVAGIALGVFPFFVANLWCSIAIGSALIVLPFVVRI